VSLANKTSKESILERITEMNKVDEYNKASEIAERLGTTPADVLNQFEEFYTDYMREEQEYEMEF